MADEANNNETTGASAEENTEDAEASSWQTQSQSSSNGEGGASLKEQTVQKGQELLENCSKRVSRPWDWRLTAPRARFSPNSLTRRSAFQGLTRLKQTDPVPHQSVETLKDDAQWAKEQVKP